MNQKILFNEQANSNLNSNLNLHFLKYKLKISRSRINRACDKWLSYEAVLNSLEPSLFREESDFETLRVYYSDLSARGISCLNSFHKQYPKRLMNYDKDYPNALFCLGDSQILQSPGPKIGIVGTRNCSEYAMKLCDRVVQEINQHLGQYQPVIISGMARGIDAVAHWAALKHDLQTIAVLGCGVEYIYPKQNARLYEMIKKQGLLVSEYLPETAARPIFFPERNRIVAGLCDVLIVIEAPRKSGSLITARLAVEQGKDVFVLPGPYFSNLNLGGYDLVNSGAYLLSDIQLLLSSLTNLNV